MTSTGKRSQIDITLDSLICCIGVFYGGVNRVLVFLLLMSSIAYLIVVGSVQRFFSLVSCVPSRSLTCP